MENPNEAKPLQMCCATERLSIVTGEERQKKSSSELQMDIYRGLEKQETLEWGKKKHTDVFLATGLSMELKGTSQINKRSSNQVNILHEASNTENNG